MKYHEIKIGKKTIAHLYTFIDYNEPRAKNLIDIILSEIPSFSDIGYAGFKSKVALRKHLLWSMIGQADPHVISPNFNRNIEKQSAKIIENVIKKCYKLVPLHGTVKLFLFPTIDPFVREKMSGSTGFCIWENAITLFINTKTPEWKSALIDTVCHEYAHVATPSYSKSNTLLNWFIFDGLAEHFREAMIGKRQSPWIKAVDKNEARKILQKLKSKLNSKSQKLRIAVFYEGKKYPLWTGYSIGYHIVDNYLHSQNTINWREILRKNPEEIFRESDFLD